LRWKAILKKESIDEMLRCCEGLKLKNREDTLRKALYFFRLLTINFPESKVKGNVIFSSCIYISALLLGERGVTQANVAKTFNIPESSINRNYKKFLGKLFPDAGKCCKTLTSEEQNNSLQYKQASQENVLRG